MGENDKVNDDRSNFDREAEKTGHLCQLKSTTMKKLTTIEEGGSRAFLSLTSFQPARQLSDLSGRIKRQPDRSEVRTS